MSKQGDGSHVLLYPNPSVEEKKEKDFEKEKEIYQMYRFLGQVLGKAMYENILIEPQFALCFFKQLLGEGNNNMMVLVDDLFTFDPILYKHFMSLKKNKNLVEELSLTFSMDHICTTFNNNVSTNEKQQKFVQTIDLVPNGHLINVTKNNLLQYFYLVTKYKLYGQNIKKTKAFCQGFYEIIPFKWIQMFDPKEIQKLISGGTSLRSHQMIDVKDWYQHTTYQGGYHPSQILIQWFWEIVEEFTNEQRSLLLKFITSCTRQPILGFGQFDPPLSIHQVRIDDDQRLPSR
jgi:ubiquitin-protein ligase E3 C